MLKITRDTSRNKITIKIDMIIINANKINYQDNDMK